MKSNYDGFRGWLKYIRDYKDNKDNDLISEQRLIAANKEIDRLKKKVENLSYIGKEKDNLIVLRDKRIECTSEKYASVLKRCEELRKNLEMQGREIKELQQKIEDKEHRRRANASTIGAKNRRIKNLEKRIEEKEAEHTIQLEKMEHKINFLEKSKHAPSKEEVLAYEKSMREVEKRQKNGTIQ